MLEVRLLGQFEVLRDEKRVAIPTRNAQALFAYLTLNAGKAHRREKLAGLFWPDSSEDNARSNLRHELWRLRKVLDAACFTTDDLTIAFQPPAGFSLDVHQLESMPVANSTLQDLIEAVSAYRGELLPGFYEEWVFADRDRLFALFEAKVARLLEFLQKEGHWAEVADWAMRWIAMGHWPEPAYRALMLAYANSGDMAKAVATYERLVQGLRKDLGVQPSEQTRTLYKRLKAGWKPDAPVPPAAQMIQKTRMAEADTAPAMTRVRPTNLPRPLTSFIGREKEIQEVIRLVSRSRLVTITGPGGVGKTRLAIQVADALAPQFKEAAWWVELGPVFETTSTQIQNGHLPRQEEGELTGASLVARTIAKALRVPESTDLPILEVVVEYLQNKQLLLVLDNCEHLIQACAILAERVLSGCPQVAILATSREALEVPGERTWLLMSLSLPEPDQPFDLQNIYQSEAVRLFIDRAGVILPGYLPGVIDAPAIAQICLRLDGIPLAIELAAARMNLLSVQEIAKHLDQRFNLLTAGSRTALPRHQTLLAAIEWSYDLLSDLEGVLFRRLSIFAGGFTLEAVESVCVGDPIQLGRVLNLVGRLVDKSLINVKHTLQHPELATRYHLQDSICHFARMKLDEAGETRWMYERHTDYYVHLAEVGEAELRGARQQLWLNRLKEEHSDLQSALETLLEIQDAERALILAGSLWRYWWIHSHHSEGREWMEKVLSMPGTQPPALRAKVLNGAGILARGQGDYDQAGKYLNECLDIQRALRDKYGIANALNSLGVLYHLRGDFSKAIEQYQEGLILRREISDTRGIATFLHNLSMIYQENCELAQAEEMLNESLEMFMEIQDARSVAATQLSLGNIHCELGDVSQAEGYLQKSLITLKDLGGRNDIIECLEGFAGVAALRQLPRRGARLLAAARAQRHVIGIPVARYHKARYQQIVESIAGQLDPLELENLSAEGQAMSLEEMVEYALSGSE